MRRAIDKKIISPDKSLIGYVVGSIVIIYEIANDPNLRMSDKISYNKLPSNVYNIKPFDEVDNWEITHKRAKKAVRQYSIKCDKSKLIGRDEGRIAAIQLLEEITDGDDIIVFIPDKVEYLSLSAGEGIVDVLDIAYKHWRNHVTLKSNSKLVQNQLNRMKRIF